MQTAIRDLHWITVDQAMLLGGWHDRQGVLAAIKRGTLQAENINPHADPRRYEYRTTVEWVLAYVVRHKRGADQEVAFLRDTLEQLVAGSLAMGVSNVFHDEAAAISGSIGSGLCE